MYKFYLSIALFLLLLVGCNRLQDTVVMSEIPTDSISVQAQATKPKYKEPMLIDPIEIYPSYVGGEEARLQFLKRNLVYPPEAKTKEIEGTITVGFVVSETGEIENIRILRGKNKLLDDEVLRVTALMPNWIPGVMSGKKTSMNYTMRIQFKLPDQIILRNFLR